VYIHQSRKAKCRIKSVMQGGLFALRSNWTLGRREEMEYDRCNGEGRDGREIRKGIGGKEG
jgi:hypothetical protein